MARRWRKLQKAPRWIYGLLMVASGVVYAYRIRASVSQPPEREAVDPPGASCVAAPPRDPWCVLCPKTCVEPGHVESMELCVLERESDEDPFEACACEGGQCVEPSMACSERIQRSPDFFQTKAVQCDCEGKVMDGLNASMAIINELNLDHATIGGDLDFTSSYIEKLSIRGAKVNAITLKGCGPRTDHAAAANVLTVNS